MASEEIEKRENSKKYIIDTLKVARWMGAKRIVIHSGSCSKVERNWALETAMQVLKETIEFWQMRLVMAISVFVQRFWGSITNWEHLKK